MGSIIVILTLLFVALILATQFSFGRLFSLLFQMAVTRRQSAWRAPPGVGSRIAAAPANDAR